MLNRICAFIHNYFTDEADIHSGTYTIENGSIALPFLNYGQYFRIKDSTMNDGVYQYPATDLAPETFEGEIWAMKVPRPVRDIATEAAALETANAAALNGPYTSESVIGVLSYTKAANATQGVDGWLFGKDGIFGARLNQYRKLA